MSHLPSSNKVAQAAPVKSRRTPSLRRLSVYALLFVGLLAIVGTVLLWGFGDALLNGYGKSRMERAFAAARPGYVLQIGQLEFAIGANHLVAQDITVEGTNSLLRIGRLSLTGVRWARLLPNAPHLARVLSASTLEATEIEAEFPRSQYRWRWDRLVASVPESELTATGGELRPLAGDEEFFAQDEFRRTRFRVAIPEIAVSGLAYEPGLDGLSYRAESVHISDVSLGALVNRDKPLRPFLKSPLMAHEALATIPLPLAVDRLSITNGHLTYSERVLATADPGVLTFGAIHLAVENLANRGEAGAAIRLDGQAAFLNSGNLKVQLTIPIAPADFSLRYSGSLSGMDLTALNAYTEPVEHIRIRAGSTDDLAFEVEVDAGHARGWVRVPYGNLSVALLDPDTGSAGRVDNLVASFLANVLKVRTANAPDGTGSIREGVIDYTRMPEEAFVEFLWLALWTGLRAVISH
ncbi:MAG: hypothetical protein ACYC23_18135 [Limisphaerales bacterium]